MALDLFANFERSSNSSLFYRVTSSSPSTFTIKLSDLLLPDEDLSTLYYVESALNDGSFSEFVPTVGIFTSDLTFDTTSPCICSVSINISAANTMEPFGSFTLSGAFVPSFLSADFIAYPSYYINETNKQLVSLNSTNYNTSPGVYFYGEGHTETINLSASGLNGTGTANWFVGNGLDDISDTNSVLPVVSASLATSTVSVSTTSLDERVYPISLLLTDSFVTTAGPIVTYNDLNGEAEYYSFFSSTLIDGGSNTKDSIAVLLYPDVTSVAFTSPFNSSFITLPLDYSSQTFIGSVANTALTSILTEQFIGTQWELEAVSEDGDWSITTPLLSTILAYQFKLSYDQEANDAVLPTFKASSLAPTTITLSVSSTKEATINLTPFDWIPRQKQSVLQTSTTIGSVPFAEIYIPNYYNIKGQDVPITIISVPSAPFEIHKLTIQSPYSSDTLILSGTPLVSGSAGTMQFDKLGVVDLSATAILVNSVSLKQEELTIIFQNMIEIVSNYDEVEEDFFQSALTPLKLTYGYQPKLTPNEWAIADNVNSIIEKIYTTIDDLDDYTKLYEKKDKFYGWLGLKRAQTSVTYTTETPIPLYVWSDLECPSASEQEAAWSNFECDTTLFSKTWEYQECDGTISDPSCLQKYCLEWKWKTRKCGASDVNVSWKLAKCNAEYAKKWYFEKCENDSEPLNCNKDSWKIATINKDSSSFPIPYCTSVSRCEFVDAEISSLTNQMVIAYPTEINLVDSDYFATFIARRGVADELFSFQNIVGLTVDSEGRVIVLDSLLPKVSVFKIVDNEFILFSTWGSYGLVSNSRGFNKPQDIHVDSKNSVWVADTGNNCVKKLTIIGKPLMTITHETLDLSAPLSVCVDSKSNVHCLTEKSVHVFDSNGNFLFSYDLPEDVTGAKKINTSYNKEMIYITYATGVLKYFRTGIISHYTVQDLECANKEVLQNYNSISQDKFRNVYVTVGDKILKIPDLQKIVESKAALPADLYWNLNDLVVHKEEYIQPWVYLKSFHRLWDNIELFRNSLFYNLEGCKSYTKPTYMKSDLIIGQNEIVTNAVINRIAEQLWTNLKPLINYFDPNCEN